MSQVIVKVHVFIVYNLASVSQRINYCLNSVVNKWSGCFVCSYSQLLPHYELLRLPDMHTNVFALRIFERNISSEHSLMVG